jgi:hypothetical protein
MSESHNFLTDVTHNFIFDTNLLTILIIFYKVFSDKSEQAVRTLR